MKLTDMNLICIEECFEYLELEDLLSLSDANKRLRKAAEFIFLRKYSKRPAFFNIAKIRLFPYSVPRSAIELKGDLKKSFQLLRCFGHMINNIHFFFNGSYGGDHCRAEQRLLDQLNEYCAASLIDFTLSFHPSVAKNDKWEMFTKPFIRAEKVMIKNFHLIGRGEKFSKIFPKIKELKCFNDFSKYDFNYMYFVGRYLHLEYLSIEITEHTTSLLHLNPQLKRLSLSHHSKIVCDEFTFRNFIEPMQNLEELTLNPAYDELLSNFIGKKIESKSIKKFVISCRKTQKYRFLFNQLEEFEIHLSEPTPHFYDFIDHHPTITKLNISQFYEKSNVNFSRISKALPSIIELDLAMYFPETFSVNDLILCVSDFKSLKKLGYKRQHTSSDTFYDELRTRMAESPLADQWRMTLKWHCSQFTSFNLYRLDNQKSQSKCIT